MAAESTVAIVRDVTSTDGSASVSDAVRTAGKAVSFQSYAPGALVTIQISNDGENWSTGTNEENSDLSSLQSLTEVIKERPEFVRVSIASDGSGPRLFRVVFNITHVN